MDALDEDFVSVGLGRRRLDAHQKLRLLPRRGLLVGFGGDAGVSTVAAPKHGSTQTVLPPQRSVRCQRGDTHGTALSRGRGGSPRI